MNKIKHRLYFKTAPKRKKTQNLQIFIVDDKLWHKIKELHKFPKVHKENSLYSLYKMLCDKDVCFGCNGGFDGEDEIASRYKSTLAEFKFDLRIEK